MTVPGRLFYAGALVATSIASLFAAQSAHAQEWLQWRGSPTSHGVDPAKIMPATTDRPTSKPIPERAASANATRLQAAAATAESPAPALERVALTTREQAAATTAKLPRTVLAPALSNPAVPIEPLPSPVAVLKEVAAVISKVLESAAIPGAAATLVQTELCDESGRCERLDATRSGVGVNSAPEDEEAKRKPETAAKRHVMQSVRSVW